ncbi:MAG: DUF1295 domain-containing protein [Alphaproteobacteria bacterium]|jgi:steroid 5-alpha reductase family enzyme|nr:DUF1295 domain-containing protein [Alphaproteobacteria bacterium]
MMPALVALLAWALVSGIWIFRMPANARGRRWSVVHALLPFAAIAAWAWWPIPFLAVWMAEAVAILAVLTTAWAIGTRLRNHGVMDIAYPLAPLAAAATAAALQPTLAPGQMLLLVLVAAWAIRLSVQTYGHNIRAEREPYATWRRRHEGDWIWWSFFQVYLLQGVTVWIWSLVFALAFTMPAGIVAVAIGLALWLTGFVFQAGADVQLTRFRADPANRGRLLRGGLWAVVRHPNYFGEAAMWWGYFCFALGSPLGLLAIVGPLYVTWFMGFGSAAPFKERHMSKTRPDEWAAYAAVTPRFFPWPRP